MFVTCLDATLFMLALKQLCLQTYRPVHLFQTLVKEEFWLDALLFQKFNCKECICPNKKQRVCKDLLVEFNN